MISSCLLREMKEALLVARLPCELCSHSAYSFLKSKHSNLLTSCSLLSSLFAFSSNSCFTSPYNYSIYWYFSFNSLICRAYSSILLCLSFMS